MSFSQSPEVQVGSNMLGPWAGLRPSHPCDNRHPRFSPHKTRSPPAQGAPLSPCPCMALVAGCVGTRMLPVASQEDSDGMPAVPF